MAAFKKVFRYLVLFVLIVLFAGCSLDRSGAHTNSLSDMNTEELTETLSENMENARSEFFEELPLFLEQVEADTGVDLTTETGYLSLSPEQVSEIEASFSAESSVENLPLREQLELLALDAAITGQYDKIEAFLKEHDLYDRFMDINSEYGIDEMQEELLRREGSESERLAVTFDKPPEQADDWLWELKAGDILFTHNIKTIYAWLVPGKADHCGIYDPRGWGGRSDLRVLSASAVVESHGDIREHYGNPLYACLGYESIYFYAHQPYLKAMRYKRYFNFSQERLFAALDAISAYGGKPYVIGPSKESNSDWYCSKVVYRVWMELGVNLDKVNFYWFDGPHYGFFVTPDDIKNNKLVEEIPPYENMPKPGAPGFSRDSGLYKYEILVNITAQRKADIYYTTDGSEPSTSSALYSDPVYITEQTTLKAIAVNRQGEISPVSEASYTFDLVAGEALVDLPSGNYISNQTVSITPDDNTIVRYSFTTDGTEPPAPLRSDPECPSTLSISAEEGQDLVYWYKFRSYTTIPTSRSSAEVSDIVSRRWRIDKEVPSAPLANHGSGDYSSNLNIVLTYDYGSKVHYTLSGEIPDENSMQYNGSFIIDRSCILRTIAVDSSGNFSPVAEYRYSIDKSYEDIDVSLPGGRYREVPDIDVTFSTSSVVFYTYTADGTEPANPTRGDIAYTAPIRLAPVPGEDISYIFKFRAFPAVQTGEDTGSTVITREWTLDRKAPEIISITPGSGAEKQELNQDIRIEFSEPLDWNSVMQLVQGGQFAYYDGTLPFRAELSPDGRILILQPERGEFYPAYEWSYSIEGDLIDEYGNSRFIQQDILFTTVIPENLIGFENINSKGQSAFFIDKEGSLWGWGDNGLGQLGIGSQANQYEPVLIRPYVKKVRSGGSHTFILTFDGTLYGAGKNQRGELGDGTSTTRTSFVKIADHIVDMDASASFSMIIDDQNDLYGIGWNRSGVFGDGKTDTNIIPPLSENTVPRYIRSDVSAVSTGNVTLIIDTEGRLYSTGTNYQGALGLGESYDSVEFCNEFQYIMSNVQKIYSAGTTSLCITNEGELYGWGRNMGYTLGLGHDNDALSPELIADDVVTAKLGASCMSYLTTYGDLYFSGQIRNILSYDNDLYEYPVLIESNIRQFLLLGDCLYVGRNDGTYQSIGSDGAGQYGNGGGADNLRTWYALPF